MAVDNLPGVKPKDPGDNIGVLIVFQATSTPSPDDSGNVFPSKLLTGKSGLSAD